MEDDIIYSYTREQAIEDGVLVDVSEVGREAGFRIPVAMTIGAWHELVAWNGPGQDESGRLWDVLWMARNFVKAAGATTDHVTGQVLRVPNRPGASVPTMATFNVVCGPGDRAEPVITILLPGED